MEDITVYVVKIGSRKNLALRYVDPATGVKHQRSAGTYRKREAERAAGVWQKELREGRYTKPSGVSWSDFRDKYETEVLDGLAFRTLQKSVGVLNSVEHILRPKRPASITSDSLSRYVASMRKAGKADATIAGHLAHLRAALAYALDWKLIVEIPTIPKLKRIKKSSTMKGRPICGEEFDRMLSATAAVVGSAAADDWEFFQRGLWASGLRLGEALNLYWDRNDAAGEQCLEVDLAGQDSLLIIPAALEKGNKDRLLPMAPEFARFLESVPEPRRTGPVFKFHNRNGGPRGTVGHYWASTVISKIGKAARVVVNDQTGKYASAHDFRRAFAERWAAKVTPIILGQLMRHESISTTQKYYVGTNAKVTARTLWEADTTAPPISVGDQLGDTKQKRPAQPR